MTEIAFQKCIDPACAATYSVDQVLVACPKCRNLLDVDYDWDRAQPPQSLRDFEQKWSRTSYQIIDYSGKNIGAISKTDHDDHVFLNEIQLLPEFQGQGIGSALITQELDRVEMMDIPMRLRVLKQNRQARKLYERLGFVVYGETEAHFLMTSNLL